MHISFYVPEIQTKVFGYRKTPKLGTSILHDHLKPRILERDIILPFTIDVDDYSSAEGDFIVFNIIYKNKPIIVEGDIDNFPVDSVLVRAFFDTRFNIDGTHLFYNNVDYVMPIGKLNSIHYTEGEDCSQYFMLSASIHKNLETIYGNTENMIKLIFESLMVDTIYIGLKITYLSELQEECHVNMSDREVINYKSATSTPDTEIVAAYLNVHGRRMDYLSKRQPFILL